MREKYKLNTNINSNNSVCDLDLRSAAVSGRYQIICKNIEINFVTYKKVPSKDIGNIKNIKLKS